MSAKDKKVETEIRTLFNQYNTQLTNRKKEVSEQLSKWSKDLIRRIEEHTATQKKLLDEHFEKRKFVFETERKRITTIIIDHEKRQETKEIEQRLAEFKNLILNLPTLHAYETVSIYMHVLPEEELPEKQRERNNAQKSNENPSNDPNCTRNITSARRRPLPDVTPTENKRTK